MSSTGTGLGHRARHDQMDVGVDVDVDLAHTGYEARAAVGRVRRITRQPAQREAHHSAPKARVRLSIMRQMKGVKISCMASSILPPGTTTVLARLMKLPSIICSR